MDDNKRIWSAEEIFGLGDTRCDYIHQFKGYETDKGWNITVQAMIPWAFGPKVWNNGYRWVTTRRYFPKSKFPHAKTVKDVILEFVKLPYIMNPLRDQYSLAKFNITLKLGKVAWDAVKS